MAPSRTTTEIATQPAVWREALRTLPRHASALPRRGERVAVIGCGTSWFMAQAYADLREAGGHGETDAFAASRFPFSRRYDRVVALTRSGTTSEVLAVLARLAGTVPTAAITADPATPVMELADAVAVLDFADEESVVQTRFATTALALFRAHLEAEDALPDGLAEEVRAVGGTLVAGDLDPLAELVLAQRLAVAVAEDRGLDPDRPRNLTRSVVLADAGAGV